MITTQLTLNTPFTLADLEQFVAKAASLGVRSDCIINDNEDYPSQSLQVCTADGPQDKVI